MFGMSRSDRGGSARHRACLVRLFLTSFSEKLAVGKSWLLGKAGG
jgi:hypothetical protein